MDMSFTRIQLDHSPPFARIRLANGRQNVLDFELMDQLVEALEAVEQLPEISTIVLSGAGEHFSAGVDIPSHTADKVRDMLSKFHNAIRRMLKTPKVTFAAVRGYCLGGGAELAMV